MAKRPRPRLDPKPRPPKPIRPQGPISTRQVLHCDRCGYESIALVWEGMPLHDFYWVQGPYWRKYGRPGEDYVCACCLFADPVYLRDYPSMRDYRPADPGAGCWLYARLKDEKDHVLPLPERA